jgi:hypothetical protein
MLLPSRISVKASLIFPSGMVWVIIGSISILPCMYQSTIFGTSERPRAAERGAAPHPPGDQLKRSRRDLLPRAGDADDDALPPAAMTAFQRRAHEIDVADAFEGVIGAADLVGAALGHVHQMRDEIAAGILRIDEMGHAEAFAPGFPFRTEIDADDHVGANEAQALDDVKPDAAEAEDDALRSRLDLGGVDHRADAGGHAAADIADLVERGVLANLRHRDFRQHGEITEGRAAHVVVDLLAVDREARGAVGHHALALGRANGGAQIGLARQARGTRPAFRRVERDDVVVLLDRGHAGPDIDDDAGALVAEDCRKESLRVRA